MGKAEFMPSNYNELGISATDAAKGIYHIYNR